MAFESSQLEEILRLKKIRSVSAFAKYGSPFEGFLAVPKGKPLFSLSLSIIVRVSKRDYKP